MHSSVVKRIEPYGVFVQLQGYRKYGLVHSSQVSICMHVCGVFEHWEYT